MKFCLLVYPYPAARRCALVSNFLEAARYTDRLNPLQHQREAWETAWGYLTPEQQEEFLRLFRQGPSEPEPAGTGLPVALLEEWREVRREAAAAGAVHADLVAAQWALESGFGKFTSGINNYFGLKGKGSTVTTTEVINGKTVVVKDDFLNFSSRQACIQYLVDRWYKDYTTPGGTFYEGVNRASSREEAAVLLQKYGYATDPAYSKKLQDLMKRMAPVPSLQQPAQQPSKPATPAAPHLRMVLGQGSDSRGLRRLNLEYVKGDGVVGRLTVNSGAPGRQHFRTGAQSQAGTLEPLPEGLWKIGDIEWAKGKDNYSGSWGEGLGPAFIALDYVGPGKTGRSAIGIHIDSNAGRSPGTAGCVGVTSEGDFRLLVSWLRETDPRELYVDWGLGTCPKPRKG